MRAGPKAAITAPPLDLSHLPRGRAARAIRFIETYCHVPKGKGSDTGRPVRLRPWQRRIIRRLLAPGVRQGLLSIPRGNGKTTLAAMLAVWALFDGPEGAQVLCIASDERQSRLVFNAARRMIERHDLLSERVQVFQDRIYLPHNDGVIAPLPAEPAALMGWDPTLAIVDELHVVTEATWEAVALASGKRDRSLTLAISTPATSKDSIMWHLADHGRAGTDPAFAFIEFAAPVGCEMGDEDAWRVANPALGDFLSLDAMRAVYRTTREGPFRQFRLGQWVAGVDSWLPWGTWAACAHRGRLVEPGERIILAFDGSASGDSTALVGCTLDGFLFVIDVWANDGDDRWRVPRHEVDAAVEDAFERYDVIELAADPWGWRSEIETWAKRHGESRVLEWNTAAAQRMGPATDRLYAAVTNQTVTHDDDPRLAAHVANCVAKATSAGDLVSKDKRNSPRKIDAAVAAIVAYDRAAWHNGHQARPRRVVAF